VIGDLRNYCSRAFPNFFSSEEEFKSNAISSKLIERAFNYNLFDDKLDVVASLDLYDFIN